MKTFNVKWSRIYRREVNGYIRCKEVDGEVTIQAKRREEARQHVFDNMDEYVGKRHDPKCKYIQEFVEVIEV